MKAGESRFLACDTCKAEFTLDVFREPQEKALSSPSLCPFCHSGFVTKLPEKDRLKRVQEAAERGFDTLFNSGQ